MPIAQHLPIPSEQANCDVAAAGASGGVTLPQQTFAEAKALSIALADGPGKHNWSSTAGEIALHHPDRRDARLQVKLTGDGYSRSLGPAVTIDTLWDAVQQAGLRAVLLLHACLGLALKQPIVTVATDRLIAAIGLDPRSTVERENHRHWIWRTLLLFDATLVIGCRRGRYRDPRTHSVLDLKSEDALIRITGHRTPSAPDLSPSDSQVPSPAPVEVTFTAGPWLDRWRDNPQVLSYFGNVLKLATIPGGAPSGAWAQAIGLTLHQIWREDASKAEVRRVGETGRPTIRGRLVTRRQLLSMFPPSPTVEEILRSGHPSRARGYWKVAIQELTNRHVIGYYNEAEPIPAARQGWEDEWLDQRLDIRPHGELAPAVAEIAQRAKSARKGRRTAPKHTFRHVA